MSPEELDRLTQVYPPFKEPIDWMPLSYMAVRNIRYLLSIGAARPTERLSAIDFLDEAMARHRAHCDRHEHEPKENP